MGVSIIDFFHVIKLRVQGAVMYTAPVYVTYTRCLDPRPPDGCQVTRSERRK